MAKPIDVLVVSSDPAVVAVVQGHLEARDGLRVVASSHEAIDDVQVLAPDIVFCDVALPHDELFEQLRSSYPRVRRVLCAFGPVEESQTLIELGLTDGVVDLTENATVH